MVDYLLSDLLNAPIRRNRDVQEQSLHLCCCVCVSMTECLKEVSSQFKHKLSVP